MQCFGQCLQFGPGVRWAVDVCHAMLRQALRPNMFSCGGLISACREGQALRRAFVVCEAMPRQALRPIMLQLRWFDQDLQVGPGVATDICRL